MAGGSGVAAESDWPCPALLPDAQVLRQGVTNIIADSGHLIYRRKGSKGPHVGLIEVGKGTNLNCGVMVGASFCEFAAAVKEYRLKYSYTLIGHEDLILKFPKFLKNTQKRLFSKFFS